MPRIPQISDAEWEVMKIIWDCQPVLAGQIVQRLGPQRGWRPRTIKTLLGRLLAKGAVEYRVDGKRYLYRARVSRDMCVRQESRSFLGRVFDGAVTPALVHFLRTQRLSQEDLAELRAILAKQRG
jgi:BlaI family penicillinase repressor